MVRVAVVRYLAMVRLGKMRRVWVMVACGRPLVGLRRVRTVVGRVVVFVFVSVGVKGVGMLLELSGLGAQIFPQSILVRVMMGTVTGVFVVMRDPSMVVRSGEVETGLGETEELESGRIVGEDSKGEAGNNVLVVGEVSKEEAGNNVLAVGELSRLEAVDDAGVETAGIPVEVAVVREPGAVVIG